MSLHKNTSEKDLVLKTKYTKASNYAFNKGGSNLEISTFQPTVVITSSNQQGDGDLQYDPTGSQPVSIITFTFSEKVKDFVVGDITTTGAAGSTYANFTEVSRDVYTVELSNSTGGEDIFIDVNASVCTDLDGNNNLAATQLVLTEI